MPTAKTAWVDFKEIKATVSIVQILEHYEVIETLVRNGNGDRLSGACPIHSGTNKTHFRVSISKNCWNCFGKCHGGGNIIDFVSRKEEVPFRDAALLIQEWFTGNPGNMPDEIGRLRFDTNQAEESPRLRAAETPAEQAPKETEDDAPNKPLAFELGNLDAAHPYLRERGLTEETIATFGVGYCGKGLLRGYVAIPIHNAHGELVGYAGRWPGLPEDGKGKYKLPKGFRKSVELFNYHRAVASEQESPLVVVEGFFDAIKLHQAGCKKVVALMGSTMSAAQEELIRLYADSDDRVIVMLDKDDAGRAGRDGIAARLSKFCFVKTHVFDEPNTQPEQLNATQLEEILGASS